MLIKNREIYSKTTHESATVISNDVEIEVSIIKTEMIGIGDSVDVCIISDLPQGIDEQTIIEFVKENI